MSHTMKSILAISITTVAGIVLLYFVYSLCWFILVGRRRQQHRANMFTSAGFLAVLAAVGLWFFGLASFGSSSYAFERAVLFISVGLCLAAIVVARFGSLRTSIPIVTAALVVALNAIGTVFMQ
jgi:predicted aspartyl protease